VPLVVIDPEMLKGINDDLITKLNEYEVNIPFLLFNVKKPLVNNSELRYLAGYAQEIGKDFTAGLTYLHFQGLIFSQSVKFFERSAQVFLQMRKIFASNAQVG